MLVEELGITLRYLLALGLIRVEGQLLSTLLVTLLFLVALIYWQLWFLALVLLRLRRNIVLGLLLDVVKARLAWLGMPPRRGPVLVSWWGSYTGLRQHCGRLVGNWFGYGANAEGGRAHLLAATLKNDRVGHLRSSSEDHVFLLLAFLTFFLPNAHRNMWNENLHELLLYCLFNDYTTHKLSFRAINGHYRMYQRSLQRLRS